MEIKVLGPGCTNCKKLLQLTHDAVKELNVDANVIYVTDMAEIVKTGIMSMPGLIVNGRIKVMGRVPKVEEIKKYINEA